MNFILIIILILLVLLILLNIILNFCWYRVFKKMNSYLDLSLRNPLKELQEMFDEDWR